MTRILPPYVDKSCKSAAEKRIFELFRHAPFAADWIILHSLNLARHVTRLYGEIDFLLLIPGSGIYVMEVKGGDVRCTDGVWYFTDRYGNTNTNKSPFSQARDAMFSLKTAIEREFGKGHHLTKKLMGFFCCFPDISFTRHSVEYEQWQILDKDTLNADPAAYFSRLARRTLNKHKDQYWFSAGSVPSADDLEELCHFLRGDFERVRTAGERLEAFDRQVSSYTEEQFRILDHIPVNDRCLIQGSAGTGKTMVAAESAIRAAANGEKILLTCYNRMIGEWLRALLLPWQGQITVMNLHQYLFEESKGFHYDKSRENGGDFYTVYLPGLLARMFTMGISTQFDRLIIDEGQDLLRPPYLQLFDATVKGGLAAGKWEIYGDFEQQAIFAQTTSPEMIGLLRGYGNHAGFRLRINCRNTRQIGEETALLSGFEKPPFLLEHLEGIPVDYQWYGSTDEHIVLERCLDRLKAEQVPLSQTVILCPRKLGNSAAAAVSTHQIREIKNAAELRPGQDFFGFSTIQAFKGMEAGYIVITGIESLSGEQVQALLYVAMSRARYGLILLMNENVREQYKTLLKKQLVKNEK
jgi:hypothetical protein